MAENADQVDAEPDGGGRRPISERTLLEQMGGVSGMLYSAVPIVVFILVNSLANLTAAIWVALGAAAVITVARLMRKETLQPAFAGFFGVAIGAFIAYRTGEARGYFLWGIWVSLVYAGIFVASVLLRWPIVGVAWNFINGTGMAWRKDRPSLYAYDIATLAFAVLFGARYVVQNWLYDENQTTWLAVARISMGVPLFLLALAVTVWAVRKSTARMNELARADADLERELRAKYDQPSAESAT